MFPFMIRLFRFAVSPGDDRLMLGFVTFVILFCLLPAAILTGAIYGIEMIPSALWRDIAWFATAIFFVAVFVFIARIFNGALD